MIFKRNILSYLQHRAFFLFANNFSFVVLLSLFSFFFILISFLVFPSLFSQFKPHQGLSMLFRQAQIQLVSSVQVHLRTEFSLIITVRPNPIHPTTRVYIQATSTLHRKLKFVWKIYSTKLASLQLLSQKCCG